MPAGYSGTPLAKKLGYKSGFVVLLVDAPEHYPALLPTLPEEVSFVDADAAESLDMVHAFFTQREQMEEALPRLKSKIKKDGMLWISWPKGKSKIPSDIKEDHIRGAALATGLVDVKVCAVDEDWSGLKLMYRKKDR